jgi:inhibitor of KinA
LRFRAASDQAVLVYLGDEIGQAAHERVMRLLKLLEAEPPPWVANLQPTYCSLLVSFDACHVDHAQVETTLRKYEESSGALALRKPRRVEIPVCYGGEFGPDLESVASIHGLTAKRVIKLHSSQVYRAYFLGFAPGFAYLGDVPEEIATPRLPSPRKQVSAGSVAIAGRQTGVYPFATPGGWRLLGRTPRAVFRPDRDPMGLISVGDEVQFVPISLAQFSRWDES